MKLPKGFRYAGVHAGLKPSRADVALVVSDVPAVAAGCFTTNLAAAAPVVDAAARLPARGVRAVVINSGNANALTGPQGLADVVACRAAVATALGCELAAVYAASTGVIGARLPAGKIVAAADKLVAALAPAPHTAAEAIMTTDTRVKLASRTCELGGRAVTIAAIAKGSGMIAPQLATALAVITTDAAIAPDALAAMLREAMTTSFNSLIIDGDTSTNDAIFVLANGLADNAIVDGPGADRDAFGAALTAVCEDLAKEIAADGEGATKQLEVRVTGAPTAAIAQDLARSIAGSTLVKAAVFGADPNWGRVLATVGARAGSQGYAIDPHAARVTIQELVVFDGGAPTTFDPASLRARMRQPHVTIAVELRRGEASATAHGCDLSYDYVKINADYTSLIVQSPDGQLAKDDRLTNYSPSLKRSLIVEALSYITRFTGLRCVVAVGDRALVKASLVKAFCDDIKLLRTVGLVPVVVVGSDAIASELVSLLNSDGGHAMGLSGNDGAMLRTSDAGEVLAVNGDVIEMMLSRNFIPVITPTGLGRDGRSHNVDQDVVASRVAAAIKAAKLIYLTDVAGVLAEGELLPQLSVDEVTARVAAGTITAGMRVKVEAALVGIAGGVDRVHVIDGRTPHNLVAELFTDRGVGTLISRGDA